MSKSSASPIRVPKYGKHKATGQARVVIDGQNHYLGRHGTRESREKYDQLIRQWLAGGRHLPREDEGMTVSQVLLAYWKAEGTKAKGGRRWNIKSALRVGKKLYGREPARKFGPKALRDCRDHMKTLGWCRGYINTEVGWIRRAFRWACSVELGGVSGQQLYALGSVTGLRRGEPGCRESNPIHSVPVEVVEQTLPYLPPVIRSMVELQLLSGCRPTEICILAATDLDMTQPDLWTYRPSDHKTAYRGQERVIFFGPRAIEVLRPWLRADGKPLFSPAESEAARNAQRRAGRQTPMTPSQSKRKRAKNSARPKRDCYDETSYRNAVYRACDQAFSPPEPLAKLPGEGRKKWKARLTTTQAEELSRWQKAHRWHPNQLRHTRGTEVRKMLGLESAQLVLGHTKCDVTQVYAERDLSAAGEIMRKIG